MEPVTPPSGHRRRSAAPALLPTFFVATAVIVLAVVALDRIHSDLGDAGAIVLVVAAAGFLLAAIGRLLDQQTQPDDDRPDAGQDSR